MAISNHASLHLSCHNLLSAPTQRRRCPRSCPTASSSAALLKTPKLPAVPQASDSARVSMESRFQEFAAMVNNVTASQTARLTNIQSNLKLSNSEPFNGDDRHGCGRFFGKCQLHFNGKPKAFPNDEAKITFVISFLKGTPISQGSSDTRRLSCGSG